jgi:hypothetical protein
MVQMPIFFIIFLGLGEKVGSWGEKVWIRPDLSPNLRMQGDAATNRNIKES